MSKTYFISILVGIVLFMFIFWYNTKNRVEKFDVGSPSPAPTGAPTAAPSGSPTTAPAPGRAPAPAGSVVNDPNTIKDLMGSLNELLNTLGKGDSPASFSYTEEYEDIPNKNNLRIYLTTFSDKTRFNDAVDIYNPMAQKWNNYMTEDQGFFIVSTQVLPASIKVPNGLPLKDKTLNGIRSDEINKTDYMLKAFTATFFLRINDVKFATPESVIEVFNIFVESPNYVRLLIEPIVTENVVSTEKVQVSLQVGAATNKYLFEIPIDALRSNGNSVVMSMVYDGTGTAEAKVYLYLGDVKYERAFTPIPTLYLGNSRIRINGYSNLDATLFSFMYYAAPLTLDQHKDIITYLNKQQSGVSNIISQITNMTETQLAALRSFVSDQTLSMQDLRDRLNQCTAEAAARGPAPAPEFKYNISMLGKSDVSTKDLESCSVLKIKERPVVESPGPAPGPAPGMSPSSSPAGTPSPGPSSGPGTSPAPGPSAGPVGSPSPSWPFTINIPFLEKVVPKEVDFNKISKGYITRNAA